MDMRPYSSFLLRCWELDGTSERVEIEHIQSHDSTTMRSITEAIEWIRAVHRGAELDRRHTDHPRLDRTPQELGSNPIEGEVT